MAYPHKMKFEGLFPLEKYPDSALRSPEDQKKQTPFPLILNKMNLTHHRQKVSTTVGLMFFVIFTLGPSFFLLIFKYNKAMNIYIMQV